MYEPPTCLLRSGSEVSNNCCNHRIPGCRIGYPSGEGDIALLCLRGSLAFSPQREDARVPSFGAGVAIVANHIVWRQSCRRLQGPRAGRTQHSAQPRIQMHGGSRTASVPSWVRVSKVSGSDAGPSSASTSGSGSGSGSFSSPTLSQQTALLQWPGGDSGSCAGVTTVQSCYLWPSLWASDRRSSAAQQQQPAGPAAASQQWGGWHGVVPAMWCPLLLAACWLLAAAGEEEEHYGRRGVPVGQQARERAMSVL